MAKVTVLDSEFLKTFINEQITAFQQTLEAIAKNDVTNGPAISSIASNKKTTTTIDSARPLILGGMAGEKSAVGGDALNSVIQKAAAELDGIIDEQTVLFEDLEAALWETIEKLNKNQGQSLEKIVADEFMEIFEDVDSSLAPEEEESDED
ncbi:type VII secretion system-associated protein [Streptomyces sp. Qhu-G9]|uniref:type VII secretion system-associated protein n=1 Tax=Streptomyces sp. Qhu-G9 TaxID=3452799 RepID=UPI0022AC5367|nr:type VII secretion system-associated protein [Streptomyces aurantiacus]WAU82109.1 type VII secretion system-associated protein [Streptomyces aurantiacus]